MGGVYGCVGEWVVYLGEWVVYVGEWVVYVGVWVCRYKHVFVGK